MSAIKAAKARGFTVNVNATIFDGHSAEDVAAFLDLTEQLGVGVSISPGYAYERAPDQEHFLSRRKTKELFRRIFALGRGKKWDLQHSSMYLDFLAGNRDLPLHPVGHADPQHLRLAEAVLPARRRLREDLPRTDGHHGLGPYGTGRYEKCANCMADSAMSRPRRKHLPQSVLGRLDRLPRRAHLGPHGSRNFARGASARRNPRFRRHVQQALAKIGVTRVRTKEPASGG